MALDGFFMDDTTGDLHIGNKGNIMTHGCRLRHFGFCYTAVLLSLQLWDELQASIIYFSFV